MKIRTLILFLFISVFAFAQNDAPNRIDAKGKKQGLWKKYEKGVLVYEGNFVNDVPTGEFKYYHANGKLKSVSNFINGTTRVKTTLYHENGQKSAEGIFVDQIKDGEWNYYNNAGRLIKTESYKNGVKHGPWRTYSSQTGTLLEEMNYQDGQLNGEWDIYYANGDISSKINYINGKRNGVTESYYTGKAIMSKGVYHDDFKIGTWEYFDADGKLRKSEDMVKSHANKTYLYFYNGSFPQKVNQEQIAYLQKRGDGTDVVLKSGKKQNFAEGFDIIKGWLNFEQFCPITPSIIAVNEAIVKYETIDENSIRVILNPAPDHEVISQAPEALFVKMMFDHSQIKEDE